MGELDQCQKPKKVLSLTDCSDTDEKDMILKKGVKLSFCQQKGTQWMRHSKSSLTKGIGTVYIQYYPLLFPCNKPVIGSGWPKVSRGLYG